MVPGNEGSFSLAWECGSLYIPKYRSWCDLNCVAREYSWGSLGQQADQINLKGDQRWIIIGGTDAEAEIPVFWSSDANNWLFRKVPIAGKDWGQKEKRASEDEMAEWHHWYNECELGQNLWDVRDREAWRFAVHGGRRVQHYWATEQQQHSYLVHMPTKTWLEDL